MTMWMIDQKLKVVSVASITNISTNIWKILNHFSYVTVENVSRQ